MTKRISIDDVAIGMRIIGMDKSWLETPFFRHRLTITMEGQIDQLRACGVQYVDVENDEPSLDVPVDEFVHSGTEFIHAPSDANPMDKSTSEGQSRCSSAPQSFEDELPFAKKIYREAKTVVQRALNDARMGRELNTEAVSRIVLNMSDSLLRNQDAMTSLSRIKNFDEYTFFHSVNTAVLALSMGRSLGMDGETLHRLGMGSLLHDIGKMKIPLQILNKPGRLREFEFEIMKQHAMRGAEVLAQTTGLSEHVIRPALEHHERVDGTGYPFGKKLENLSQFGLISSVVDVYDAITSDRVYHKAMPAYQALGFLFDLGKKGHLEPSLVAHFIRCVGVYPVGSCVVLNTGEIGIVTRINRQELLRPKLMLVRDQERQVMSPTLDVDLAVQESRPERAIMTALDHTEVGIDPGMYLDPELQAA